MFLFFFLEKGKKKMSFCRFWEGEDGGKGRRERGSSFRFWRGRLEEEEFCLYLSGGGGRRGDRGPFWGCFLISFLGDLLSFVWVVFFVSG